MANKTQFIEAVKAGDWVLPILVNGDTVHALQINKSKEDKENIDNILAEYQKAGVPVYRYSGKNNNDVLLVEATKKLKTQRASVTRDAIIETLMETMGVDMETAQALHAKMQQNVAAKKANK